MERVLEGGCLPLISDFINFGPVLRLMQRSEDFIFFGGGVRKVQGSSYSGLFVAV